jgi:hypothetical protein
VEGLHPPGIFTSNEKRILPSAVIRKRIRFGDWPVYNHLSGASRKQCAPAVESRGRTVEAPKIRCEELSLGALDEQVDVGGDFDGDAVDMQGTVSPLPDGGERGVGEDRVTGADADG